MVGRKYETVDEFFGELETMCNNAFTYNEDDSEVFKDAKQIKVCDPWQFTYRNGCLWV